MTIQWIPLISLLVINLALDLWLFRFFRKNKRWPKLKSGFHAVLSMVLLGLIVAVIAIPRKECDDSTFLGVMWTLFAYYAFYVPRYLAAMVWAPTHLKRSGPRTRRVGGIAATVLGIVAFLFMWSGVFFTTYTINVNRVELEFEDLPQEFDGYRVVQFSDTHLGTYNGNTRFMEQCVDSINTLKPDLICFTGDLVSRHSGEAKPFITTLSRLHAPDGVISVLGNHDDGHYKAWPTEQARLADMQALIKLQEQMGWKVLVNDHIILKRDTSEVAVVGTKCFLGWPIPKNGYLDSAYVEYDSAKRFIILLQHVPDEWKLERAYQKRVAMVRLCDKVDLMLSGHTHAMQVMINFFGHKFTPAIISSDYPAGLYTEGDNKLYTNIGLGMVGMPVRLGCAYPEITLITLKKRGDCIVDENGKRINN